MRAPLYGVCLALLLTSHSVLADSLRCGNRLVSEGMSQYEVLSLCGDPAFQETVKEPVYVSKIQQGYVDTQNSVGDGVGRQVFEATETEATYREIQRWTYDLGSGKFLREVDFAEGKVIRITSIGRAR